MFFSHTVLFFEHRKMLYYYFFNLYLHIHSTYIYKRKFLFLVLVFKTVLIFEQRKKICVVTFKKVCVKNL